MWFGYVNKKMSSFSILEIIKRRFINIFIVFVILNASGNCLNDSNAICEKFNVCQCVFPGGMGIDLSHLVDSPSHLWMVGSTENLIFYFQPCYNAPFAGVNECSKGASLCFYNVVSKNFTLLGTTDEANFSSMGVDNDLKLKYIHNKIETTILLKCEPEKSPTLVLEPGSTDTKYELTLQSSNACKQKIDITERFRDVANHSLSTGSVLVIIFFTFAAVYLIGGALVLKLTRGAEGKELIPNYEFWADLPALVRDGALFVVTGGQPVATYDRI